MPRTQRAGKASDACAQLFIGKCMSLPSDVCGVSMEDLHRLRARWVGTKRCSDAAFAMAMGINVLREAMDAGELSIPGSNALETLFSDETLPCLVASRVVYSFLPSAFAILKGGRKTISEQSVKAGRERFGEVSQLLQDLKRTFSLATLPDWAKCESVQDAWSRDAARLIRKGAAAMMEKWDRFIAKDDYLDSSDEEDESQASVQGDNESEISDASDGSDDSNGRSAAPISNDYTESLMASGASILGRLRGINPARAAAITQHKHNAHPLRQLGVSTLPTEEEVEEAKRLAGPTPPAAEEWARVHKTKRHEQLRTALQKRSRESLRDELAEHGVPHASAMLKPECVATLTDVLYKAPQVSTPPSGRPEKRRAVSAS